MQMRKVCKKMFSTAQQLEIGLLLYVHPQKTISRQDFKILNEIIVFSYDRYNSRDRTRYPLKVII